jgi:hypothetical protein
LGEARRILIMQLLHDIQTTTALEKIEKELREAHTFARQYGTGWEYVEELQKLHAMYVEKLASEGHTCEPVLAQAA